MPSDSIVRIELPPCHQEVLVRRVQLYDEGGGELLSWLLRGVIAKMIGGYTPDQRNALMAEAQKTAEELAAAQAIRLGDEVQKSAVSMLTFMASGGGSRKVSVQFDSSANHRLITVAPDVLALPSAA